MCAQQACFFILESISKQEPKMAYDPSKNFISRFDEMFNRPNMSIADEIFAPFFSAHVPLMPTLNRSGYKGFWQSFYSAFSGFRQDTQDRIVTTDRFVLRVIISGTHQGDFLGIPATQRVITIPGIHIFRVENDLVVENWTELDIFGVLRQISNVPSIGSMSSSSIN